MYGHVSVWLHESYEGYGSLEKILHYDQMLRCYGVTGPQRIEQNLYFIIKHPCTVMFRYGYMRVTRVMGLWKNIALCSNVTVLRGNWPSRIEKNLYFIIRTV